MRQSFQHLFSLACLLLFASACSVLDAGSAGSADGQPTVTPLPTASFPGFRTVAPQACRIAEQRAIRIDAPQGDLLAWSPVENALAYVAPTGSDTWMVGELMWLAEPGFDTPERMAVHVFGDLEWSPDGRYLAYVSLRPGEGLYTAGVVIPPGIAAPVSVPRDLFPDEAARSDDWDSQKAIVGWSSDTHVLVLTSCGLDCMQPITVSVVTGLANASAPTQPRHWDIWDIRNNQPSSLPAEFASLAQQANESPDGLRVAYLDQGGGAWLADFAAQTQFPLDIGEFGTAYETAWSADSQYLAVRVDDRVFIFSFQCP